MKAKTHILGILVISVPLFFFSCKKDREVAKYTGEYTITGKVIDEITGKGILQATVGVIEQDRDATSHLGGKTVAFDKSDADGNFTLTFSANSEKNNYELTANALTYFERSGGGDIVTFTKNGSKTQNIYLLPQCYLKVFIKGNKGGYEIASSFGGNGGLSFYQGVDTSVSVNAYPNKEISFNYFVYYPDTAKNYKETVVLPPTAPHDTAYCLIEF
ncbi:MAG: peptidase associated/transthyretin-like domain-containing protein [Bacteroidia bacterium]